MVRGPRPRAQLGSVQTSRDTVTGQYRILMPRVPRPVVYHLAASDANDMPMRNTLGSIQPRKRC